MEAADKELLIRWRPELVENVDVLHGLLTHLQARKVLNSRMVQTITFNNPPDRQVELLLDLLPKRGPQAFAQFCDSLVASDQEEVVKTYLTRPVPTIVRTPQAAVNVEALQVNVGVSNLSPSASNASGLEPPACSSPTAESSLPSSTLTPVPVSTSAFIKLPAEVCALTAVKSSGDRSAVSPTVSVQPSSSPCVDNKTASLDKTKLVPPSSKKASEHEDTSSVISPSETDSSPLKRARSGSFIRIHDRDEKVIKICGEWPKDVFSDAEKDDGCALYKNAAELECKNNNKLASEWSSSCAPHKPKLNAEEVRYVLKHFVSGGGDENVISRPQPVCHVSGLELLQPFGKGFLAMPNYTAELMKERLSRCDSTDTMEDTTRASVNQKKADGSEQLQGQPPTASTPASVAGGSGQGTEGNVKQQGGEAGEPSQVAIREPGTAPLHVHVQKCSRAFYKENERKSYRMVSIPRGQALIINVNEVLGKPPRRGTDIDRDNLHNLLRQLHFSVTVYNDQDDLTAQGIADKLRSFVQMGEHQSADACMVCLLSHGEEGYMFGTDGKKIPLEEIFILFDNRHCPALLNKPKVFFIQACRGVLLDHGVKVTHDELDGAEASRNSLVQHPSMSDMLICYPTMQGYYAWRNRERGSWYIEAVVKIFMKFAKEEDICAMLNRVNNDVSRKVSRTPQTEMDRMSQMSEYKSSLRQPYLFFFPGIGAPPTE